MLRHRRETNGYLSGEKGDSLGVWDWRKHTTVYKIDSHKYLLYNTENYTQCFVIAFKGQEDEKNINVYIWLNHLAIHLKLTQYCK